MRESGEVEEKQGEFEKLISVGVGTIIQDPSVSTNQVQ